MNALNEIEEEDLQDEEWKEIDFAQLATFYSFINFDLSFEELGELYTNYEEMGDDIWSYSQIDGLFDSFKKTVDS